MRSAWLCAITIVWGTVALAQDPPPEEAVGEEAAQEDDEPAETRVYALSADKSWIYVTIYNDPDRWTPVNGHDHGIRATVFSGSVTWNLDDASACKVDIRVPYAGLKIDPPGMRERLKFPLDGAISDSQKKKVVGNMLSKGQLDSGSFTEARFVSSSCSDTSGQVDVTGTLTIRGASKQVIVPMQIAVEGDAFTASGGFALTHADFGMKPFTYGPGTPKNQDKLVFGVDVVGKAR